MFQINHLTICQGQYQKSSSPYCLEKFATICFERIGSKCRCSCFDQVLGSHCLPARVYLETGVEKLVVNQLLLGIEEFIMFL